MKTSIFFKNMTNFYNNFTLYLVKLASDCKEVICTKHILKTRKNKKQVASMTKRFICFSPMVLFRYLLITLSNIFYLIIYRFVEKVNNFGLRRYRIYHTGITRRRNPKPENWERNMFCDLIYCADCGRKPWFNVKHDK